LFIQYSFLFFLQRAERGMPAAIAQLLSLAGVDAKWADQLGNKGVQFHVDAMHVSDANYTFEYTCE